MSIVVAIGWNSSASAQPVSPGSLTEWVPGRLVIRARGPEAVQAMRAEIRSMGLPVIAQSRSGELCCVHVPIGFEEVLRQHFKSASWARWVTRDFSSRGGMEFNPPPSEMPQPSPGTPFPWQLHDLWFLQNSGQTITADVGPPQIGDPGADIDVLQAWTRTQGDPGVLVAVLDSGIDQTLPEFAGRIYPHQIVYACDLVSPPPPPPASPCNVVENQFHCCGVGGCAFGTIASDTHGHGTAVASVLAANVNNGLPGTLDGRQFAGVDPRCTLVAARVTHANLFYMSQTLLALQDIRDNPVFADVRVINLSFQGWQCPIEDEDAQLSMDELHQVVQQLYYRGVVIVTIAGNADEEITNACPALWPEVITVGATDNQDNRIIESRFGAALDFVAPGWGMYVAIWNNPACNGGVAQYGRGTSAAAPIVAGIASLLFARADKLGIALTPDMVYECLRVGAEPIGLPVHNNYHGWGRVNAYKSIMALEDMYYDCPADLTHGSTIGEWGYGVPDGTVDSQDLAYFSYWHGLGAVAIADIAGTCPTSADCETGGCSTPNGVVDPDDLTAYMCLYNAGCP
ncbi:MAG: S8 family serine peptidase [Phycisphaerales bacterium]|nr:S8 family serine peptidase [Phycisphaerales bacterium]